MIIIIIINDVIKTVSSAPHLLGSGHAKHSAKYFSCNSHYHLIRQVLV